MTIKIMAICCLLASISDIHGARAENILITRQEAALPVDSKAIHVATVTREITRRPEIVLVTPEAAVTSPFTLHLKFRAHGGSKITPSSFRAIYLKSPNVDLTSRIAPFLDANGVDMVKAEAPPGHHEIIIKINDSEGREGSLILGLTVIN